MSSEITCNLTFRVANGYIKLDHSKNQTLDQATAGGTQYLHTATTSDITIAISGVTTLGIISIRNTNATNYVDIGATVAGAIAPLVRLKAGEQFAFRLKPGITLRSQANTASCILEITLLEA